MKYFKYDDTEFSISFPENWTIERDINLIFVLIFTNV
jgi:hypothetical protein